MAHNAVLTPKRHLSIRVPWQDNGWDAAICDRPHENAACLRLTRIAQDRDDEREQSVAGRRLDNVDEALWPPCTRERMGIMGGFEWVTHHEHPYKDSNPELYGHLQRTPLRHPPYSALALPFRWMLVKEMEGLAASYGIDVDPEREPQLGFKTSWVQEAENQKALLDAFFAHVRPLESLCFFYAKEVPFVEDRRRVLVGVGRVTHVGECIPYEESHPGPFSSVLWERCVQHSIRPGFADGFLLPYERLHKMQRDGKLEDASVCAALVAPERMLEFSYASEHVTADGAIEAILALRSSLQAIAPLLPGPWESCQSWLDERLGEMWRMRGPFPGLASALCAFGLEKGVLVAREIEAQLGENEDPWPLVDRALLSPKEFLSAESAASVSDLVSKTWGVLVPVRRSLLKLVSRLDVSPEEATNVYRVEKRRAAAVDVGDRAILENPYLLYECTRLTATPIALGTVDRALFPDRIVRDVHPLPGPSHVEAGNDARRVRARIVATLEERADDGHTVMPRDEVALAVASAAIDPPCPLQEDMLPAVESTFDGAVLVRALDDGRRLYQLQRFAAVNEIISRTVTRRLGGKRLDVAAHWRAVVDDHLGPMVDEHDERETDARNEKAAALEELASSRFSVLIGPAGTGKTTVVAMLSEQPVIAAGGVLFLAPTGKARVRMEQHAKSIKGFTIAQFLSRYGRYEGETGRYLIDGDPVDETAETVIVDEASMLTEEMLAAVFDALRSAKRMVLVGDPRQLPPIGAGRPFVDIVDHLASERLEGTFPRVDNGYAELTIRRRQVGGERRDLQLADWFAGVPLGPGADEVFNALAEAGNSGEVSLRRWDSAEELREKLLEVMAEELRPLGLQDTGDQVGFGETLGGSRYGDYVYFRTGAADHVEDWQVLSPVRAPAWGVNELNHLIHRNFRAGMLAFARSRTRSVAKPLGSEQIVYGDKVINPQNHPRDYWQQESRSGYVANGEIGVVIDPFRKRSSPGRRPRYLDVEFSSQPRARYRFFAGEFGEESSPALELAYVLTVHKAQGSEFGLVLLVLPNPCALLSRELLYTALTRQQRRVVILHQGEFDDVRRFSHASQSETARRLTNLFREPRPVVVSDRVYEASLIHVTSRGELVRSKSEVIIADRLAAHGVDYLYEKPLTIDGVTKLPDFTIEDAETGRSYYWEHCGMLRDPDYRARWEAKKRWYESVGILPLGEVEGERGTLIVTADGTDGSFSSQAIDELIRRTIG